MDGWLATAAVACVFAAIHLVGPRLRFLIKVPRSVWLSAAGGVSVAYVLVHVLPELAAHQDAIERATGGQGGVERHVYLMALAGLAFFYGLDRVARRSAARSPERRASTGVFWLHLAAFAVYNVLIGYLLLHREDPTATGLVAYAVAMALHFVVNDQGLRQQHGATYDRSGRWLLAAAPPAGWILGSAVDVSPVALAALFSALAGGVLLNAMKEELPEDRDSRFSAFAAGAAGYALLLLAVA